jgi:CBS domain-containing protein
MPLTKRQAMTASLRKSVVVDRSELGPLPGYGVLKELKTQKRFDVLHKQLDGDSTPALEPNEIPTVVAASISHEARPRYAIPVPGSVGANIVTPPILTGAATPSGASFSLREHREPLKWAAWAVAVERMLTSQFISSWIANNSGAVKWLDAQAAIGDALRFMKDNRVTGVPIFRGTEPVDVLELADIAAALCTSPRPSYAQLLDGAQAETNPLLGMTCGFALGCRPKGGNCPKSSWWLSDADIAAEVVRAFAVPGRWRVAVYGQHDTVLCAVLSQTEFLERILSALGSDSSLSGVMAHTVGMVVPNVYCVEDSAPTGLVFASMVKHRISGLGVVKKHRLVGQVSFEDLALVNEVGGWARLFVPFERGVAFSGSKQSGTSNCHILQTWQPRARAHHVQLQYFTA